MPFPTFVCRLMMLGGLVLAALPVGAAISSNFDADTGVMIVTSDADDDIRIDCEFVFIPASIRGGGGYFVIINGTFTPDLVPCADVERFIVNGGPGGSFIDFVDGLDPARFTLLTSTIITGGPGDDEILGSFADDINLWFSGDGSDRFDARGGNDLQLVEGGAQAEVFLIENGSGSFDVHLERSIPSVFALDLANTETLELLAGPGDDSVDASMLDAGRIALRLFGGDDDDVLIGSADDDHIDGGAGNDTLIGGPGSDVLLGGDGDDASIWHPGDGSDTFAGGAGNNRQIVQGGDSVDPFFIGPNDPAGTFFPVDAVPGFEVLFKRDPGFRIALRQVQELEVHGNGGDDRIDASAVPAGLIALELFGGDGDDVLIGGAGDDDIEGGSGNDMLIGGPGSDVLFGAAGDDLMIWNPGDGSDVNDGGEGIDTTRVNGDGSDEKFIVDAGQPGFDARLDRTAPVPSAIDIINVEHLHLFAGDGRDSVTTSGRPGIAQFLDGGDPDSLPGDDLVVAGFDGDLSQTPLVSLPGAGPIEHIHFEFAPPAVGILGLAPELLDFGSVPLGQSSDPQVLTLSNSGEAAVNVSSISVPSAPFGPDGGSCGNAPFTLAVGATCTLAYRFAPADVGDALAEITIDGDAENGPQHQIMLRGAGSPGGGSGVPQAAVAVPATSLMVRLLLILLVMVIAMPVVRRG